MKVFAVIGVLVVLFLVISLALGIKHGPGRHGGEHGMPVAAVDVALS